MATPETRRQLLAAVAACEDKKGEDTRILELDPADSGLADFFLITSASNDRQVVAIADEIEMRLKKEFGLYATSVEGRRQAEWILLDYVDIVIHVFLAEKRAFYDIERLRKSARNLTSAELEAEVQSSLAHVLAERTRAVRSHPHVEIKAAKKAAKEAAKVTTGKSPATSTAVKAAQPKTPSAKTSSKGDSKVTAKPVNKAATKAAPKPVSVAKAKTVAPKVTSKAVAKPGNGAAPAPMVVGALAPEMHHQPVPTDLGAKPPILKCEDPDMSSSVNIAASAAPKTKKAAVKKAPAKAAAKPAVKAATKKAPIKAVTKAASAKKAPAKAAAKKSGK